MYSNQIVFIEQKHNFDTSQLISSSSSNIGISIPTDLSASSVRVKLNLVPKRSSSMLSPLTRTEIKVVCSSVTIFSISL